MLNEWLNRPFPFLKSFKDKLLTSVAAGLVVFFFLAIFQPFGINILLNNIIFYLLGFGLITTIVLLASYMVLPGLFPVFFNEDNWTIRKYLYFIAWILVIITLCNFAFGRYIGADVYPEAYEDHSYPNSLLSWFFMTFTVGVFPVSIIIYVAERKLNRKNEEIALKLSREMGHMAEENSEQIVAIELGKNKIIDLPTRDFICARAEGGNYLSLFWTAGDQIEKAMVRLTLQELVKLFDNNSPIIRCHKSFVVNRSKIRDIKGNARSLMLMLSEVNFEIPVSRSFPREQLVANSASH